MHQLFPQKKGHSKNSLLLFSLLCFTALGTPLWGMEEQREAHNGRTNVQQKEEQEGNTEKTLLLSSSAHKEKSRCSTCSTIWNCLGSIPNYVKMAIGFARATYQFKMLGQDKLNKITKCSDCPPTRWMGNAKPLTEKEKKLEKKLRQHIEELSNKIGPRNFHEFPENLLKAERYITSCLRDVENLNVTTQEFTATFKEIKKTLKQNNYKYRKHAQPPFFEYAGRKFLLKDKRDKYSFTNIIAEKKGTDPEKYPTLTYVAHYDTVQKSPGADDNDSSIAVLLQLAKMCSKKEFPWTIRFVFVPNEEWPLSRMETEEGKPLMGSYYYFKNLNPKEKVDVIALDAVGYFSEQENSQDFKLPILNRQYGTTIGNFIAFVGKAKDRTTFEPEPLLVKSYQKFTQKAKMRAEFLNAPIGVYGVDNKGCQPTWGRIVWGDMIPLVLVSAGHSDHHSAWVEKINSAILITDTAGARNPNYHTVLDKIVNYPYLTRLTKDIFKMTDHFYEEDEGTLKEEI